MFWSIAGQKGPRLRCAMLVLAMLFAPGSPSWGQEVVAPPVDDAADAAAADVVARDAAPAATPATAAGAGTVYRIPLTGVVEMGLAPFIQRALSEAAAAGAVAAILDIDTPGGRVDAAEQIADAISDSEVPVYAYVNRRALSAGALIALAAEQIYMRPGSTLGAATPVTGDGATASEKIVSAMRSAFRSLAEARGLDPRVAEAMVDEEIEIPGVVDSGKLLTLSTEEAVRLNYAASVEDWNGLLVAIGADGAAVVVMEVNWAERVVRFLTHPLVAPFLLSLGFLGLLIEIKTPAFGLAGLAGLSSLALFFGSHFIIGLAGWEVALLLGLGVVLLLVELLVLPGFGVAGVLGALAIVVSIFLSLVGRLPTTSDVIIAVNVLAGSMLLVGFASWQLVRRLPADRRGRNLLHREELTRELGYVSAKRRDELLGQEGVTVTDLRPAGVVLVSAERIDAVSEGPWVAAGTPVRIVRSEGYRHVVVPI
jgi:membrane-bound serine protease (ClpP class)